MRQKMPEDIRPSETGQGHCGRRSFVNNGAQAGVTDTDLAAVTGHKSLNSLKGIYCYTLFY